MESMLGLEWQPTTVATTTAITNSGRAIRRVANGESNPALLFPDDNSSKSCLRNKVKMSTYFVFDSLLLDLPQSVTKDSDQISESVGNVLLRNIC